MENDSYYFLIFITSSNIFKKCKGKRRKYKIHEIDIRLNQSIVESVVENNNA